MKLFYNIFTCLLLASSIQAQAQLKVKSDTGKIVLGTETVPTVNVFDPNNHITVGVFGALGSYKAGGRLSFGDYNGTTTMSRNVFVGEYVNPALSDPDTDQMWLHGKLGTYFTSYDDFVYAKYDANQGGRFRFNVGVDADVVAISSDRRYKSNIKKMADPLGLLKKLEGVTYDFTPRFETAGGEAAGAGAAEGKNQKAKALFEEMKADRQAKNKQIGFIAQDLQQVFPELVLEDKEGYLSVNYIGLIPVIVEALKEQENTITTLKERIAKLEAKNTDVLKISTTNQSSAAGLEAPTGAVLYQNTPNPFSQSTRIEFFLPEDSRDGALYVFNLQGILVKTVKINGTGKNHITLNGSELAAGMYVYSLFSNGKEVDTKRMILTK